MNIPFRETRAEFRERCSDIKTIIVWRNGRPPLGRVRFVFPLLMPRYAATIKCSGGWLIQYCVSSSTSRSVIASITG